MLKSSQFIFLTKSVIPVPIIFGSASVSRNSVTKLLILVEVVKREVVLEICKLHLDPIKANLFQITADDIFTNAFASFSRFESLQFCLDDDISLKAIFGECPNLTNLNIDRGL